MSSEIHKHIEQSLKKNINLFNAEVIDFPKEKKKIFLNILRQPIIIFGNFTINRTQMRIGIN